MSEIIYIEKNNELGREFIVELLNCYLSSCKDEECYEFDVEDADDDRYSSKDYEDDCYEYIDSSNDLEDEIRYLKVREYELNRELEQSRQTIECFGESIDYMSDYIEELVEENEYLNGYSNFTEALNSIIADKYVEIVTALDESELKYNTLSNLFDILIDESRELVAENQKYEDKIKEYEKFEKFAHGALEGADIMMSDYNKVCAENERLKDALHSLGYRVK